MKQIFHRNRLAESLPPETGVAAEAAQRTLCDGQNRIIFDAILYPNRSLSRAGFWTLMGVVIAVNLLTAFYYTVIGAWPVIPFAIGDVVIIWLAFRISYRQGHQQERVAILGDRLVMVRTAPAGGQKVWSLPAYWVKLHYTVPMRHESQIELHAYGKILIIGAFLSPREREELASALKNALRSAKQNADPDKTD